MKITKGYTLSQFVDKMYNLIGINTEIVGFDLICQYNDFLKQPLKKEMFVNEIEKPLAKDKDEHNSYNGLRYVEWVKAYREAEKKVIFKGYQNNPIDVKHILTCFSTIGSFFENATEIIETQNIEL